MTHQPEQPRRPGPPAGAEQSRRPGRPVGTERAPAFHELLLAYRAAAKETQDDLAAALGLQAKAIKTYERPPGHPSARTPPVEVFARLCAHLREQGVLSAGDYAAFAAARATRRRRRHSPVLAGTPAPLGAAARWPQPLLPRRLTALIGRNDLVAQVCALAQQPDVALITLTGPGGIGKTHLALEVARRLRETASQKVWWVELAAVASAEAVAATIAERLGALEPPSLPARERLLARLAGQTTLLVLDNFEHLLDAALLVSDLLAHCEGLNVLVTSRTPLRLHGEQERAVPPLAPAAAGQLFLRRVHDLRPDIARTLEHAAAIDAICARLDGVPLALELAARQMRRYRTPQALLEALDPALPRLADGPRDAPARQQTMRAAIAWSYALLDSETQALFRRLSGCRGGCTLAAAQALGTTGDAAQDTAALVDLGLVQCLGRGDDARLLMFEVVREYGLEQLEARREMDAARARHADYYCALAEEAMPHLAEAEQGQALRLLDQDHDNMRAALQWAVDSGDGETALRLASALWRYWERRGHGPEGRQWLDRAFALAGETSPTVRAYACYAAARLATLQADAAAGERWHAAAEALAVEIGDQRLLGDILNSWGGLASGWDQYARSVQLHEQALRVYTALGDTLNMGWAHYGWGVACMLQWEAVQAESHYEQTSVLLKEAGDLRGYALARFGVGICRSMAGDWANAMAAYREALTLARRLRDANLLCYVVPGIAAVVGLRGDGEQSARLFGAAARLHEELALALPASYQTLVETTKNLVQAAMEPPEAFAEYYRQGEEMSVAQMIELARQCAKVSRAGP